MDSATASSRSFLASSATSDNSTIVGETSSRNSFILSNYEVDRARGDHVTADSSETKPSGSTSCTSKFRILLWKNFILQKRHPVQTIVEILLPLVFLTLPVLARIYMEQETMKEITFSSWAPTEFTKTIIQENIANQSLPNNKPDLFSVYYSPNEPKVTEIMTTLQNYLLKFQAGTNGYIFAVTPFATEKQMLASYENHSPGVLAAIIFQDTNNPDKITYKLRFPSATDRFKGWLTDSTILPDLPLYARAGDDKYGGGVPGYYMKGFTYLQYALDASIIKFFSPNTTLSGSQINTYSIKLNRFPFPPVKVDAFISTFKPLLPILIVLSFVYSFVNIAKSIVLEKEKKLKESMKMMGLPNYMHWTAWFLKNFLFLLISIILIVIMLKFVGKDGLVVFRFTDWSVLFVFFLVYIFALIMLAFLVSTLFSKANSVTLGASVIWFRTYFPYFIIYSSYDSFSEKAKIVMCLLPNLAMAFGIRIICSAEGLESGIHWSNIQQGDTDDDTFGVSHCIAMLALDGVVFLVLAIYLEAVFPGEFGVPLPWYFPLSKSYWCGSRPKKYIDNVADGESESAGYIEAPPHDAKAGVRIKGLCKTFGKKKSVQNLTLDMFENQITVLLGQNGAGKTTTMSMLTGLFPPTAGTAIINNFDIRTNMKEVRGSLGICPQHDVLFDELTCEEHLKFFCWMKGSSNVKEEVDRMLAALELEPKRKVRSTALSGGMKRKLSVGIALAGGSRVVLFDEPTSGMDPGARRSTWDLITSEKKNRTILLSTHFMDEADLLGDRIAIMADGQLQTVGSSLFLKKKYGVGYHLVIVKRPDCAVDRITEVLMQYVGMATAVEQDVGAELSYSLPNEKSKSFPAMFDELEKRKEELGIDSYGASITAMEEVFMRVCKEAEKKKVDLNQDRLLNDDTAVSMGALQNDEKYRLYTEHTYNSGCKLRRQQLKGMIRKRWLYSKKHCFLLLILALGPVLTILASLLGSKLLPPSTSRASGDSGQPLLRINLDKFKGSVTTLACPPGNEPVCDAYEKVGKSARTQLKKIQTSFSAFALEGAGKALADFNSKHIVAMEKNGTDVTGFFNNQPNHGIPITLNLLMNALLKDITSDDKKAIFASNHPLPVPAVEQLASPEGSGDTGGATLGLLLVVGMSFFMSSFVIFIIKERESRAKHLQFVSGARYLNFWLANFIFDYTMYLIPAILIIILFAVIPPPALASQDLLVPIVLLLLLYGWAEIPLMYLLSFRYTVASSGFLRMIMFNLFLGVLSLILVISFSVIDKFDSAKYMFLLIPNLDLGFSISQLSTNFAGRTACGKLLLNCKLPSLAKHHCCKECGYLGFCTPGIGLMLVYLFGIGLLCFIIIFIKDGKLCCCICSFRCRCSHHSHHHRSKKHRSKKSKDAHDDDVEDSDVAEEAERIQTTKLKDLFNTENLIVKDLSKSYGSLLAVQGLHLGVKPNECFGLLGVNGAGKTTTFKMLTGELKLSPSAGDAFICGHSIKWEIKKVQKNLGYCPQFDGIIEELTGRETIRLFARLRGIEENEINDLANKLGANLLFSEHMDKPCGTYSGGNKRKLSTAIALIGNPPLVFLDEPTAGMDPVARRHVWNCISKVRDAGASIILTSNSMEECEALCTRLVVMTNGHFRCLGSTQHLKSKFGEGYTVIAQISTKTVSSNTNMKETQMEKHSSKNVLSWQNELKPLRKFIETSFPGCVLKDVHPGYVHYMVSNPDLNWGALFRKMEEAKELFNLDAYSVGQTSLEQVFLNFAKGKVAED